MILYKDIYPPLPEDQYTYLQVAASGCVNYHILFKFTILTKKIMKKKITLTLFV